MIQHNLFIGKVVGLVSREYDKGDGTKGTVVRGALRIPYGEPKEVVIDGRKSTRRESMFLPFVAFNGKGEYLIKNYSPTMDGEKKVNSPLRVALQGDLRPAKLVDSAENPKNISVNLNIDGKAYNVSLSAPQLMDKLEQEFYVHPFELMVSSVFPVDFAEGTGTQSAGITGAVAEGVVAEGAVEGAVAVAGGAEATVNVQGTDVKVPF